MSTVPDENNGGGWAGADADGCRCNMQYATTVSGGEQGCQAAICRCMEVIGGGGEEEGGKRRRAVVCSIDGPLSVGGWLVI